MRRDFGPEETKALVEMLRTRFVFVPIALFLIVLFMFKTLRVGNVSGEEVGVMLNRLNGNFTVVKESGVRIYNGLTTDFFVLDKTMQTLDMTVDERRGDRQGKDDLKIKTVDGSDVYVDLKVQYRITPEMADTVLLTSGPGDNFKEIWARDYVRSICRNYLGELTTEEFYDAFLRDQKIGKAQENANDCMNLFGIVIDSIVIPRKPHFYDEYEEMIKKKKLADQAVLEEQSKADAAKQKQETMTVQETNKKNVAVEQFDGEMQQKIIQAEAEAEKARKTADAYYERTTVGAGAALYRMQKEADAILATKKAEAEGIEALKQALEGEGGRNMVKMEYAKKLKNITITGKPFTIQNTIERFEHLREAAASRGAQ